MSSFLYRNWLSFRPKVAVKQSDALRMGLLGASNIAPMSVILPAKSSADLIVAAVAARDENRARSYATKHEIPNVLGSYQALLDDPTIDAVYIALPNGLHYEWTLKALKAGKHVLLEKPSVSNASEARDLFRSSYLTASPSGNGKPPLVCLDAVHTRFHPAFQKFLSLIDKPNIAEATASHFLTRGIIPVDDIRFEFDLAGGCTMDLGSYSLQCIRQVFGAEPEECIEATTRLLPEGRDQRIDMAMDASWRFPNGGIGRTIADLRADGGHWFPWLTSKLPATKCPFCSVKHRERVIPPQPGSETPDMEEAVTKTITFWLPLAPSLWHRIDVVEGHVLRNTKTSRVRKRWTHTKHLKHYKGEDNVGDESWTTYRHQLEQFINRVRGRKGSGVWIDAEDSVHQMEMIDMFYAKAGLPLRPTSTYKA